MQRDSATLYYAQESVAKGWSRELLLNALKLKIHESQPLVSMKNSFASTLPAEQAKYANEVFRGKYNLGFLGVTSLLFCFSKYFYLLCTQFTFVVGQYIYCFNMSK